ncbi:MAG: TatD family hydrolase [Deltaproteobacteria bacterium]|nr:TatD family hydrolase [Deltaproteobacteria bacterium]
MVDTHCHLDAERFDADRDEVLARAFDAGVAGLVIPGVSPDSWEPLLRWPGRDARVQVALGIHPQALPELPPGEDDRHLRQMESLLTRGAACAVGECGLDGPSVERGASMERQAAVLEQHLALAVLHDLPVLLHCYKAHDVLLPLLQRVPLPRRGLVLHSYSGGAGLVAAYARLGCWFSFAGPVTWEKARKPLEALRQVPMDRLLAETDAPDQAPVPHRGGRCEPMHLQAVLEGMARGLGLSAREVAARTGDNARAVFGDVFRVR